MIRSTAISLVCTEVPATPRADEARQRAEQELARAEYREGSVLGRLLERIWQAISGSEINGAQMPLVGRIIVIAALLLLILSVLWLLRALWRQRRRPHATEALFEEILASADHAERAREAAAQGEWNRAVLEEFRALIRHLDESGLLTDYPGLTAQEAAQEALTGLSSPAQHQCVRGFNDPEELETELGYAASLFDQVRYTGHKARAEDYARLRRLATQVGEPQQRRRAQASKAVDRSAAAFVGTPSATTPAAAGQVGEVSQG